MQITSAVLLKSASSPEQYPPPYGPEIAVVGRSNVGKSSLINALLRRKNLAQTSSTPGKTQLLNFYGVNNRLVLVDFPGYGYARVPEGIKRRWPAMVEHYLHHRPVVVGAVHIVDIRHPPSAGDKLLQQWLAHYRIQRLVVATKADKVSRGSWQAQLTIIRQHLGLGDAIPILPFSAKSGEGVQHLWQVIQCWCREATTVTTTATPA